MLKLLHYISLRFNKKNLLRSIPIYGVAAVIGLLFGVKGLATTAFLIFFFFLGWIGHSLWGAIKDYRLTLRLNRVHYSQADYETLRRENKALLQALEARMDDKGGRGVKVGVRPPSPPAPTTARLNPQDIEELRLRYEQEEREEYDRASNGSSRHG